MIKYLCKLLFFLDYFVFLLLIPPNLNRQKLLSSVLCYISLGFALSSLLPSINYKLTKIENRRENSNSKIIVLLAVFMLE
jgi:Ca2+/H+ antiporter